MPGGDKNITPQDNPKPFEKGVSGNPNGRPVKVFSEISKEFIARGIERATPERVKELYEYLLALPMEEIKEIAEKVIPLGEETSNPAIMKIAAEEMVSKKKREILNDMLDRAHGKARQAIEHTGKDGKDLETGIIVISKTMEPPKDD